ncbi:PREDICTED: dehydrogenase/reductase SDR family member 7 [Dipodomys ordii]|uniref:Dehydrogenase/reductase SDR family member 7 n=1 Tax=Dipodomys ordii TaxID=10020 RepID=A0A1S3F0S6_DIPOR|nr:PREDICTED: dehydrogenase/reductase SDR family member 7 [Dipodomys ordii]
MSWALVLWLLELCALLLALLLLLRFLRADCDLTLMWAEWQGRRPEWELTDMVVWVTGASSGIGEELVYQLSKLGVSLVLSARRVHELERVKRRCLENGNLKEKDILVLPLDLTDRNSHEVATKTVLQEFGFGNIVEFITLLVPLGTPNEHEEMVGNEGDQSHKMATSRCVQLMLISMANDLKEVWIGDHPYLLAAYICQYMPTFGWWLVKKFSKRRIENFKKGVDADSSYFKVWKRKHD